MIESLPSARIVKQARHQLAMVAIRRQLRAVASGKSHGLSLNLEQNGMLVAASILDTTRSLPRDSPPMQRLIGAFEQSGALESVISGLASHHANRRIASARIAGALGLEPAVSWLAPLLKSADPAVATAGARALGDLGGARSAEELVLAIQRSGPRRIFIVALARAAPDLFLEVTLSSSNRAGVRMAAALAAGLRRRRAAVRPLMGLLSSGNRRERVAGCKALGWIGAGVSVPAIAAALHDREWRVRVAAIKALAVLKAFSYVGEVDALLHDRDPHVRRAARRSVNHMWSARPTREGWGWP